MPNLIRDAFTANGFPLIEFDRKPIDPNLMTGFALGWNTALTLIQLIEHETFRLNGYAIFRNLDVRRWRPVKSNDFLARAARVHRLRPSRPAAVRIDSLKVAIVSSGTVFPLITIHRERIKRGACHVGKMLRSSQRALTVLSINPQADWEKEETYLFKDITLVQFGGVYERLLFQLAPKSRQTRSD